MRAKDYKDGHGWCSAHIDDRHKCVNFKLVEHTHNCCKNMLITGECDERKMKKLIFREFIAANYNEVM
jgi:hypothetical protein